MTDQTVINRLDPTATPSAAPAVEMPPVTVANIQIASAEGVQVTVREGGGESWLRMLRAEIENGSWAMMLDRHRTLLPVMANYRDHDTGLAYAPFENWVDEKGKPRLGLEAATGLSASTLRRAIAEFCAAPATLSPDAPDWARAAAGLLARRAPHLYAVYPGRVFAGRRPQTQEAASDERAPVRGGRFGRAPVRASCAPVHENAHGCAPNPVAYRETRASSERIEIETSVDDCVGSMGTTTKAKPPTELGDYTKSIRLMTSGPGVPDQRGFRHGDAAAILAESEATLAEVQAAILNANDLLRRKKLQKTWTGYVRAQLINGVTLFRHLAEDQDNSIRVIDRIRMCAERFGDESTCDLLTRWVKSRTAAQMARLIGELEWRKSDEKFWGLCIHRAMSFQEPRARNQ